MEGRFVVGPNGPSTVVVDIPLNTQQKLRNTK